MKKMIATVALGALLVGGFVFAQDNTTDTASNGELEPSIFNMMNFKGDL
ncbi:hypothetical protein [Ornithinibacillus halophilus]|uniref:PapR protein n=1 Tax=Ornithinibacillus halophilus TaxID=930117 RepID=A0A1M5EU31_9BACI|nr:hypothetical protein [Ornithinibacillus halophilus]SHF82636.1 hypothetical protein SAMN05216225_100635 [Ornithinibacillus halophilus]